MRVIEKGSVREKVRVGVREGVVSVREGMVSVREGVVSAREGGRERGRRADTPFGAPLTSVLLFTSSCTPHSSSHSLSQVSSDGDPHLIHWVKEPSPFIGLPPPNMNLTGWRDPFVVERPCEANGWEWIVLMGSGAVVGGCVCLLWTCCLLSVWQRGKG